MKHVYFTERNLNKTQSADAEPHAASADIIIAAILIDMTHARIAVTVSDRLLYVNIRGMKYQR